MEEIIPGTPPTWLKDDLGLTTLATTLDTIIECLRTISREVEFYGINSDIKIRELVIVVANCAEMLAIGNELSSWTPILDEEPTKIAPDHLVSTLTFLRALTCAGAGGPFLGWILAGDTQSKIVWWRNVASGSRKIKESIRQLQHEFLITVQNKSQTLESWTARNSERCASARHALETLATYSKAAATKIYDFGQAQQSLAKTMEIEARVAEWEPRIGMPPINTQAKVIAEHRRWNTSVRMLPTAIGNWVVEEPTGARPKLITEIGPSVSEVLSSIRKMGSVLHQYGPTTETGPFEILTEDGDTQTILTRIKSMEAHLPELPAFAGMLREEKRAGELGVSKITNTARNISLGIDLLIRTFRAAVEWQQAKAVWTQEDGLRLFSSNEHENARSQFKKADTNRLSENRKLVAKTLAERPVAGGYTGPSPKDYSEWQLIQHEIGKKKKHLPIRKLVTRAGRALQDIALCWAMTPLAVAQFLPGDSVQFDVVIMDEASQLTPEDT